MSTFTISGTSYLRFPNPTRLLMKVKFMASSDFLRRSPVRTCRRCGNSSLIFTIAACRAVAREQTRWVEPPPRWVVVKQDETCDAFFGGETICRIFAQTALVVYKEKWWAMINIQYLPTEYIYIYVYIYIYMYICVEIRSPRPTWSWTQRLLHVFWACLKSGTFGIFRLVWNCGGMPVQDF